MNLMHSTLLNSTVANQVSKNVKNSSNATGCENTKEDDRFEMWMGFGFGLMLSIGCWLIQLDSFIGAVYLVFYLICKLAILTVAYDDEQDDKVVKTALKLSAILTVSMLLPLIASAKDQVDIVGLVIWCLCATTCPLVKLLKMKKV